MNTLHARIKSKRLDRGLSQSDLAEQSGVSQPTVTNWENGSHVPRKEALFKISKILDVETIWLLSGENTLAGSPAQQYLDKPIRHIPVYDWPNSLGEFPAHKPLAYYPFATEQIGMFGILSNAELLIFDRQTKTYSLTDMCLFNDAGKPILDRYSKISQPETIIARLHTSIITH